MKLALNLSVYKGMNNRKFASAENEAEMMINLKPTGNGLEWRNGGKEIGDTFLSNTVDNATNISLLDPIDPTTSVDYTTVKVAVTDDGGKIIVEGKDGVAYRFREFDSNGVQIQSYTIANTGTHAIAVSTNGNNWSYIIKVGNTIYHWRKGTSSPSVISMTGLNTLQPIINIKRTTDDNEIITYVILTSTFIATPKYIVYKNGSLVKAESEWSTGVISLSSSNVLQTEEMITTDTGATRYLLTIDDNGVLYRIILNTSFAISFAYTDSISSSQITTTKYEIKTFDDGRALIFTYLSGVGYKAWKVSLHSTTGWVLDSSLVVQVDNSGTANINICNYYKNTILLAYRNMSNNYKNYSPVLVLQTIDSSLVLGSPKYYEYIDTTYFVPYSGNNSIDFCEANGFTLAIVGVGAYLQTYIMQEIPNPAYMVETQTAMLNINGEYIYNYGDDLVFTNKPMYLEEPKDLIESQYKNILVANVNGKPKINCIVPKISVLFKKSSITDADVDACLFEYEPDMRAVVNVMLTQRSAYNSATYGAKNVDNYTTVSPLFVDYVDNNNIELGTDGATSKLENIALSNGYYNGTKTETKDLASYPVVAKSIGRFFVDGSNVIRLKATPTTTYAFSSPPTVTKIIDIGDFAGNKYALIHYATSNGKFMIGLIDTTITENAYAGININDVALAYKIVSGTNLNVGVFVLTGNSLLLVNMIILANGNVSNTITTKTILSNISYSKIDCNYVESAYSLLPFVLMNTTTNKIEIYTTKLITGSGIELVDTVSVTTLAKEDFPFVKGNMLDVSISPNASSYDVNRSLNIGILPFFGYNSDTDAITQPSSDIYSLPIQEGYECPINIDVKQTFNPMNATGERWKYWLFYMIPPSPIEASVTALKLCKGQYDGNIYTLKAFAENPSTEGTDVDRQFPTFWSADSVALYKAGLQLEVVRFDNYDEFIKYGGSNNATIEEIDVVNTASQNMAKALKIYGNATADAYAFTRFIFRLKKDRSYRLLFDQLDDVGVTSVDGIEIFIADNGTLTATKASLNQVFKSTNGAWASRESNVFTLSPYITKDETDVCIRFDIHGGASTNKTLQITNLRLVEDTAGLLDAFTVDSEYRTNNQEEIKITNFVSGDYNIFLDEKNNIVIPTLLNIQFPNKNNAVSFSDKPIAIAETGFGYVVATEKDTFLLSGKSIPFPKIKIHNDGMNYIDRKGLLGAKDYAVMYNRRSVYLITGTKPNDIGAMIEPYITEYDGNRFVAIDEMNGEIYIPVNPSAQGDISDNGDVANIGIAIYSIARNSWRIYTYVSDEEQTGFVKYSKYFETIIGDAGDKTIILEQQDKEFRDAGFLNETWDIEMAVLQIKETSMGNVGYMKKIDSMVMNCASKRANDDEANPDNMTITFYQDYNSFYPDQNIAKELPLFGVIDKSISIPIDVNVYSASMRLLARRRADLENPKLIYKDLIFEIIQDEVRFEGSM